MNGVRVNRGHLMLKSWITINERGVHLFMRAVHPSVVLKGELAEVRITLAEFARQIDVPLNRVSQIISGKRSVTGDTALRFRHWFGCDPQFWLNLQAQFELAVAAVDIGDVIKRLPTKSSSRD